MDEIEHLKLNVTLVNSKTFHYLLDRLDLAAQGSAACSDLWLMVFDVN